MRRPTPRDYGTTAYGSIAELADQQPDLVSVATPPGSHVGPTLELLQRGRSVLLEKPPTANLVDLDTLIAADEASSGTVYGVFQHRHGSGARRAHRLLGAGALGRPQVAVCETLWYRPDSYFLPDWRGNWAGEGGGPTLGHGIHQIDLLLHLMGPWTSVRAQSSRLARPVEFEDVSLAMITFASGAVGTIVTSLLSPTRAQPDPDRHHGRDAGGRSPVRLPRRRLVLEPCARRLDRGPERARPGGADQQSDPTAPVGDVVGRQPDPSTCPATTPPRSTGWSTTCWPAAGTRPP